MKRLLAILGLAALALPAAADDLGVANTYNAFIFGNAASPGGHSDGAVAVGGNWTMDYLVTQKADYGTAGADNKVGIYVGGNLTATNKPSVNNGSNAYVGGTFTGSLDQSSGGSFSTNVSSSLFSTQKTYSENQSAKLKSLGGTAINTSDLNNWSIDTSTQSGSLKVFTINASDLSKLRTLAINNMAATNTLVINVLGTTVSDFGVTVNSSLKNRILWNFADATTITIGERALEGSILAPNAIVNQKQNIEGNLIADGWNVTGSVELHGDLTEMFNGNIPAIPEPAFYQMAALLAFGSLGLARYRRRSAAS